LTLVDHVVPSLTCQVAEYAGLGQSKSRWSPFSFESVRAIALAHVVLPAGQLVVTLLPLAWSETVSGTERMSKISSSWLPPVQTPFVQV
jgi:hypothetical protein